MALPVPEHEPYEAHDDTPDCASLVMSARNKITGMAVEESFDLDTGRF
ncbi:hypothetical protein [Streptomyces sp. NPDC049887]